VPGPQFFSYPCYFPPKYIFPDHTSVVSCVKYRIMHSSFSWIWGIRHAKRTIAFTTLKRWHDTRHSSQVERRDDSDNCYPRPIHVLDVIWMDVCVVRRWNDRTLLGTTWLHFLDTVKCRGDSHFPFDAPNQRLELAILPSCFRSSGEDLDTPAFVSTIRLRAIIAVIERQGAKVRCHRDSCPSFLQH